MNFEQMADVAPARKYQRIAPHIGNTVNEHVVNLCPELRGMKGAFLTGSNVWKFLYDEKPDPTSDVDVIVTRTERVPYNGQRDLLLPQWRETRRRIVEMYDMQFVDNTFPSIGDRNEEDIGEGVKYLARAGALKGRTVDIWFATNLATGLRSYPGHSHGHARAAWCFHEEALVVMPNYPLLGPPSAAQQAADDLMKTLYEPEDIQATLKRADYSKLGIPLGSCAFNE